MNKKAGAGLVQRSMQRRADRRRSVGRKRMLRRRRRFLSGLLLLAGGLLIMGFTRMPLPAGSGDEAGPGGEACWETYIVRSGDTLWDLAVERYEGDPRRGVERIREWNGLDGAGLYPGQELKLQGCRLSEGVEAAVQGGSRGVTPPRV